MTLTLNDIAAALGATVEGQSDIVITGAAEPAMAGEGDIALAMDPRYGEGLSKGNARAAILWEGADWKALGLEGALFVPRARYAMSGLTKLLDAGPDVDAGIHATAVIHDTAVIGDGAAIGPFVVVGRDVVIGKNARIGAGSTISEATTIGDDATFYNGVRVGARVTIGDGIFVQSGAVIGADGFSFVTPEKSSVEKARENLGEMGEITAQSWTRIHSIGTVEIGDDVEVGANACIDRGTIRATKIGRGTKIDNLVHIGHNVEVGQDCLLCGQVGIAGSTVLGDRVVLGGQCGVSDNIKVGSDVVAGGGTNLYTNVPSGRAVWGPVAVKMETQIEMNKALRRLPRMMDQFKDLQKTVSNLVHKT